MANFPDTRVRSVLTDLHRWQVGTLLPVFEKDKGISSSLACFALREFDDLGFVVYASNNDYASRFITKTSLASNLARFDEVELVELDMLSSMIRLVSILKTKNLGDLMDFVLLMGRAA